MSTGEMAGLRLEWWEPGELEENPANWRRHPAEQAAAYRALKGEVGWAGALLYNEGTGRLIDGHLRRAEAVASGEPVPVLVGTWTPQQEQRILAELDPIGALAEANEAALAALVEDLEGEVAQCVADLIAGLPAEDEWEAMFENLPRGDKAPFQQMTFTLHNDQAELVKQAIMASKAMGQFINSPNQNSNGNALARICEVYLGIS